jgi:hypothetical protein
MAPRNMYSYTTRCFQTNITLTASYYAVLGHNALYRSTGSNIFCCTIDTFSVDSALSDIILANGMFEYNFFIYIIQLTVGKLVPLGVGCSRYELERDSRLI